MRRQRIQFFMLCAIAAFEARQVARKGTDLFAPSPRCVGRTSKRAPSAGQLVQPRNWFGWFWLPILGARILVDLV
jgi:hypothetical protein